jgi:hypothetical protein
MKIKNATLAVCATLILASCTDKKSNEQTEILTENASDCNCSELGLVREKAISTTFEDGSYEEVWKDVMRDGKPFTGVCITKDQNDSIIKSLEFKNGWTVRKIERVKVGSDYITVGDMTYDNMKRNNGFRIKLETDGDIKYVHQLEVLKGGNADGKSGYTVWLKSNDIIPINKRLDEDSEMFVWDKAEGLSVRSSADLSNCLADLEYANNEESSIDEKIYYIENASPQQRNELLECLKKQLPKFNYGK